MWKLTQSQITNGSKKEGIKREVKNILKQTKMEAQEMKPYGILPRNSKRASKSNTKRKERSQGNNQTLQLKEQEKQE